ncbi:hypothetical protein AUR04nite_13920 [Glutamicibacter uratoxydans]|uniref:Lipopolysaccharide assembly protein A domain-containing protein n=1 Tax=Glutamicibacter uratoxydans TaxID=43667 RepID=A0A4Y4DQR3_GLUUR|nr:hypothetical protein [Glutamicibacter uratoxydans]GED05860.1 hypothetical protein AUR04nite_13920 [Glutamicibacter uratoxydans]
MSEEPKSRISKITGKQWASIALVVVALVFILQNLNYVRVEIFLFHTTAPLWLILLATLAGGYLIGRFSKRRD